MKNRKKILFNDIHIMGYAGISMSAIGELLTSFGYNVSGCDLEFGGHCESHIREYTTILYSAAISLDEPELVRAKKMQEAGRAQVLSRSEALGILMAEYKNIIAVAGTHGKTTTTGLIASILECAFSDISTCTSVGLSKPTILIGGHLSKIDGKGRGGSSSNLQIGTKDILLLEACEYKRSFLHFKQTHAIILNTYLDHTDYFNSECDIIDAYKDFATNTSGGKCSGGKGSGGAGDVVKGAGDVSGVVFLNADDSATKIITGKIRSTAPFLKVVTFGIKTDADYMACNIVNSGGKYCFRVNEQSKITLNIFGEHNVYNALAAYAFADVFGIDKSHIVKGICNFKGVKRRMERINVKPSDMHASGLSVYTDYAHHPREIKAAIKTIMQMYAGESITVVFQPHTYTRTQHFWAEYLSCFDGIFSVQHSADSTQSASKECVSNSVQPLKENNLLILNTIYPAREKEIKGVTSKELAKQIKKQSKKLDAEKPNTEKSNAKFCADIKYISCLQQVANEIKNKTGVVLIMGAGDMPEKLATKLLYDL
ncbi:MAG: Mur ligase family protein [Firmicutes bacterium]|nr:Mur ligase family protein [Bacillota bacterium]